jgi:sensor histidine kinase YesM
MQIKGDHLLFEIENSKTPSQPKLTHRKSGGIGLVNVRRRLNLLYDDRYQLKINNEPNLYRVILDLNLKNPD